VVTEGAMMAMFLVVALEFFVTHICDRRLVKKRGSELRLRPPLF
jgi:hypothetical protein